MGTINYGTSDYITIGYDCNNYDEADIFHNDYVSDLYKEIYHILKAENFNAFSVELEPGYYKGFYINIHFDYYYFSDYTEKQEAQKEVTALKKFLLECINNYECVAVFPGWCTGYANYKDTLKELKQAIKQMRADVKSTPTAKNYKWEAA